MLEILLIAQCSLTLPNGSIQNFEFCGTVPRSSPSVPAASPKPQNVPSPEYSEPSPASNVPISYKYLTKENWYRWQALAKSFDPVRGQSPATLSDAASLFGNGRVIQRKVIQKGVEMQKIKWEELNRSVEAWFNGDGNLVTWSSQGF